jgi:hypothetical protein
MQVTKVPCLGNFLSCLSRSGSLLFFPSSLFFFASFFCLGKQGASRQPAHGGFPDNSLFGACSKLVIVSQPAHEAGGKGVPILSSCRNQACRRARAATRCYFKSLPPPPTSVAG